MCRYLRLFFIQIQYALAISMTYRADFLMWLSIDIGWTILQLFFFSALYSRVQLLGGWSYGELLVLLGWYRIASALFWGILWSSLWNVPRLVNSGDLDMYLMKPVNTQFMLSSKGFSLSMLPSLVVGCLVLLYGVRSLGLSVHVIDLIGGFLLVLVGLVVCYALWFMTITVAFYVGRLENIIHVFPEMFHVAQFPTTAFPVLIQQIITFVVPIGIITMTPARLVLHEVTGWEIGWLLISAGLFLYISSRFWNLALRAYTSASS